MPNHLLASLLALQENDVRQRDLQLRLVTIPKELDAIIAKRDKLNAITAAAGEKVKKTELAIKNGESRIQALTEESQKLQQQSALVKKNDEYQAMLAGIARNKNAIGEIEEQIIALFDTLENLKAEADKVKRANAVELRAARTEFEELLGFSKVCKQEVEKLKAARPALAAAVNPDLLSRYERILRGKDAGLPVVKVESNCCSHCHMKVTLQTMNQLSKGDLESCDNCQHLLYLAD